VDKDCSENPQTAALNDISYFQHIRHDLIKYVCHPEIKTILSVGCAYGRTEKVLIDQYGKTVYGVEFDKDAAKVAAKNGVRVIGDDANKIDPSEVKLVFDCIIFADVLEHLYDPFDVLKRCTALLKEGGIVCISVPNFRHYSVLYTLFVKGIVRYRNSGIFDKGHLRITTRKMVIEWLDACGLKLQAVEPVFWGRRNKYLSMLFLNSLSDFIAQQMIVVGRKGS
jgi:2-polyprenyl-3-methyl-5-hydroxy-6-metoxy-1,4-benzoquinol methylase